MDLLRLICFLLRLFSLNKPKERTLSNSTFIASPREKTSRYPSDCGGSYPWFDGGEDFHGGGHFSSKGMYSLVWFARPPHLERLFIAYSIDPLTLVLKEMNEEHYTALKLMQAT